MCSKAKAIYYERAKTEELGKGEKMKNLMIESIYVGKDTYVEIADINGKITQKGVQVGEAKNGKAYARCTLTVPTTDYDVKHAEFVLYLKDKHLTRNGEDAEKKPLLFVDVVGYGKQAEFMEKNLSAGDKVRILGRVGTNEYKDNVSLSVTVSGYDKEYVPKADEASVTPPISDDDMDGVDW